MTVSSDRTRPVTLDEFVTGLFVVARLQGRRSFRVDREALVTGMRAAGSALDQAGPHAGVRSPVELTDEHTCQDLIIEAVLRAVERGTLEFEPTGQGDGRIRVGLSTRECDLVGEQVPGGVDVWSDAVAAFARVFAETAPHERPSVDSQSDPVTGTVPESHPYAS